MKIQLNEINKSYAGEFLFTGLNLEISQGSKVALVGENGSGKSTLLKIISQEETIQGGDIFIPRGMSVAYMKQTFPAFTGNTRAFILSKFDSYTTAKKRLKALEEAMAQTSDYERIFEAYSRAQNQFELLGGYDFENTLETYAKGLGIEKLLDKPFKTLSGGQKTRSGLVQLLLSEAEVLCLDEPTNHLDIKGIEWLESYCKNSTKTLILVSHDRVFLRNSVSIFHEIQDGDITTYHGSYESYREQRKLRFETMVNDFAIQQKEIQRIKTSIKRYRQWGNESDNEDFFKRAKSLEKRLERIETLPKPIEIKNKLKLAFDIQLRSSKKVFEAQNLVLGYEHPLTKPLSFTINWQDRIAFVGENGVGKSTLINTLLQKISPISGTVVQGERVDYAYLQQQNHFINPETRVLDYVQSKAGMSEFDARGVLARFGFYAHDVYKPLSYLSGGEAVRIRLLLMMLKQSNCIILDEPTNHLDIASCEIIEDVLLNYRGTLLIVSHDRMLVEKLHARIIHLEKEIEGSSKNPSNTETALNNR